MKMESIQGGDTNEMEAYGRLIRAMSDDDLVKTFEDLHEAAVSLGHHDTFSHSVIDITNLKAFTEEMNPRVKLAEVEQKIVVLQEEMERRGILETV